MVCTAAWAASTTPGSGGYGFSLDESLYVVRSARGAGGLPATYGGILAIAGRGCGLVVMVRRLVTRVFSLVEEVAQQPSRDLPKPVTRS